MGTKKVCFPSHPKIRLPQAILTLSSGNRPSQLSEESHYIACNITDEILDLLPQDQQDWILDFRNKNANEERRDPGHLPANVWVDENAFDATETARDILEEFYHPQILLYWSDESLFKYAPESSAGGIVFRRKDGLYCQIHISHDMRMISSQYDSELLTLIHAIKIGLKEANRRFFKGIFVREIIICLDPKGLLWRLRDLHYSETITSHYRELFRLVRLCRDALIDVRIFWVPKKAELFPHALADEAAKAQNEDATRWVRDGILREEFDLLEVVPPVRDFVDFVDRTVGERERDEEKKSDGDWKEAWRQLRRWEILFKVVFVVVRRVILPLLIYSTSSILP